MNDNADYQIFCGRGIVEKWHVPDHTKNVISIDKYWWKSIAGGLYQLPMAA